MNFPEDGTLAEDFSRLALERMQHSDIPPTPPNFTVWYSYATGRMPELNQSIEILIGNQQTFDM